MIETVIETVDTGAMLEEIVDPPAFSSGFKVDIPVGLPILVSRKPPLVERTRGNEIGRKD